MKEQRLYSLTRQALDQYHMLEDGDSVAVGISGGKDSLTLLWAMAGLRRFYPKTYTLHAITVDLGYDGVDFSAIVALCEQLEVDYHIVPTRICDMLPKEHPCSLCSRLRKGALNEKALELGCNKIAYGHHMDDVVETLMLSLMYEGRFSTFWPVTPLEKTGLTLIRPLVMIPEADIIGFQHANQLPVTGSGCHFEENTERAYIKELLREMNHHAPGVKKRLFTAITDGTLTHWTADEKKDCSGPYDR